MNINIKSLPIEDLLQATADYNPRKELAKGDVEYERLKKSIQEFGYVDPIIYNAKTGRVVGGHQRLKVLADLGYTVVDVSVVDLTETQEKALNIRLNKSSGEWDNNKLHDLLADLNTELGDLDLTGFDNVFLDDLTRELDFQNTMNASFLDNIIDTDIDESEEEYEDTSVEEDKYDPTEEVDEEVKEELFTLKYPVTYADRDVVMEALALAKTKNEGLTSPLAIVEICRAYIKADKVW